MDSKYIMISGMKRTGSTWQANAVRIICEEVYEEENVWIGEEYKGAAQNNITINKVHPYIRPLAERADYVFTSWRNLMEVRSSWKRFKGSYPSNELFQKWIRWLVEWNLYADHMMRFSRIDDRRGRLSEFYVTANILGIQDKLSREERDEAFERLENIEPPSKEEGYDERTLMFPNHITSKRFQS